DKISGIVSKEAALRRRNRDGEVSKHAIAIGFPGITIQASWLIDRENVCPAFQAQPINLTARRQDGIAQRGPRSEAEQAVENDCVCTAWICLRHGCHYSCRKRGSIAELGDFFA